MLTPEAHGLRAEIDWAMARGRPLSRDLSGRMLTELFDHCTPTAVEFEVMTEGCVIAGLLLYRLVMDAPELWRGAVRSEVTGI